MKANMKFTWNSFGIMAPPHADDLYIYAVNEQGDTRKLSRKKYPNFGTITKKCSMLVGYPVIIRTSQNSSAWSTNKWFSDISLKDDEDNQNEFDLGSETLSDLERRLKSFTTSSIQKNGATDKITILQEEFDALPSKSRDKIINDTKIFSQIEDLIGSSRHIHMRGNHPFQTLALRAGIDTSGRSRLNVKILEHAYLNNYNVEFVDFGKTGLVGIGIDERDGNDFYLATCLSIDRNWRKAEPKITGLGGKNRSDLPLSQFLDWHNEIKKLLYLSTGGNKKF